MSQTFSNLISIESKQTHLHIQHEKEKVVCGLLGAVPTQNKKTFSPLLPIHLACNSKMVKLTGMSPSFKIPPQYFPPIGQLLCSNTTPQKNKLLHLGLHTSVFAVP